MKKKCRIGVFGGSFDPVHCGHIELADNSLKELSLDKVIFVPAKIPPHKLHKRLSPLKHRLAMLKAALKPHVRFSVSRYELNRRGTTFTYKTLGYFRKFFKNADLFLIIGSDSLNDISSWKNLPEILRSAEIITGIRKGFEVHVSPKLRNEVHILKKPIAGISSSEIRRLVRNKVSVEKLVPKGVFTYLAKHAIY
jgi:nicotinate-nucleotide adenylyltransferase